MKSKNSKITLEGIKENFLKLGESKNKASKENVSFTFPIDAFPKRMQDILNNFQEASLLPMDFYCLALLAVCGGTIGNTYVLRYKSSRTYSTVIYACIVGDSSIGKTPVLKTMLRPLYKIEKGYNANYKEAVQEWEALKESSPDKPKPVRQQILINDATIEALNKAHDENPKGLLLFQDEFIAWLNSQNQYRKGSDNEFWLAAWSGTPIKVNRLNREIYISNPCISVLGGIQPKLLKGLVRNNNKDNGFLYRVLFAYPENAKKPYETDKEIDAFIYKDYVDIIKQIHNLKDNLPITTETYNDSLQIPMSNEAKDKYREWKDALTDEINKVGDDSISSLFGKLETYCLRFALILDILEKVCEGTTENLEETPVTKATIEKAMKLTEYFKESGLRVLDKIDNIDPLSNMPENFKRFYKMLPNEFTTKEAVELGENFDISERTLKRRLSKEKNLFTRLKQGYYNKAIL